MILLVEQNAFALYASRVSARMPMMQDRARQLTARGGDDWFGEIVAFQESAEFELRGQVAVIPISGFVGWNYDFWMWLCDGTSYTGIINKVRAAADDSRVSKIVLDVNSPGGGYVGVIEAANAIFEARSKKEIVAVVNPEAASAGYWLASQASRVVCLESGSVGCIGTEIDYTSYHKLLADAGIDVAVIRSTVSPDKNLGHAKEPISDAAKKYFQERCEYTAADFIEHIARGRNVKSSIVAETFGKGRMFFGRQAKAIGMIDSIGDLGAELFVPASAGGVGNRTSTQRVRSSSEDRKEDRKLIDSLR